MSFTRGVKLETDLDALESQAVSISRPFFLFQSDNDCLNNSLCSNYHVSKKSTGQRKLLLINNQTS